MIIFGGLVAQLVEQCPFNSKPRILAIFSRFLFPFVNIAEPLISLAILYVSMLSLVISKNPTFFNRVTSRVQVFLVPLRHLRYLNLKAASKFDAAMCANSIQPCLRV